MSLTLRSLLSLIAAGGTLCYALAYNVSGVVVDSEGDICPGATVRLLRQKDSVAVKSAIAGSNGRFSITDAARGHYILETSYIGSRTDYRNISISGGSINADTIVLAENALMLGEAVVTGVRTPIKVKEDTIEFAADAYKTAPNAVVEDLLKRLPGVEVGSDGKITSNGKEVTKILIDGKEFFADDPKVASKNLPVNMIDKLQVVDRKSDLARITGVDDGEEETVINLTVKKGMKNGWFGNAEAGYGTDSRYKGSFNVNRFWNDNQITLLGGINNINEPGFTDGASGRFRRFGGSNGLTTSKALGVNFNVGNKEIFRVGGDVMYSYTDQRTITHQDRKYKFNDSTSSFISDKYARDRGHNVRADLRIQWKPDTLNTLEIRPTMSYNSSRSFASDSSLKLAGDALRTPVTNSRNISSSKGDSWEFGVNVIYNHRFASRPGRSFSVNARFRSSNVHEYEDSWSRNLFYLMNDSLELYDQYMSNHTWSNTAQARLSWTEPLGNPRNGNFLTLAYNIQYRWNNADRLTYDNADPFTDPSQFGAARQGELIFNESLSNSFRNHYMNQDVRLGFKHVSRTQTLDVGVSLVPQRSSSHDLIDSARDIPVRTTFNFAPYLRYRWKIAKQSSLNIDYRGRSSQPSMSQLQPVADMSDPLRVTIGNPNLDPTFTHNLRLRFQDFNAEAQRSIMAMLFANMVQNSIVSRTTFYSTTGGRVTTYENVNGVWSAFGMFMFSMPFSGLRTLQFNVHTGARYQHNVGFNNNLRNTSSSINWDIAPSLAWRPDYLELELRPRYSLQSTSNTVKSGNERNLHSYGGMFYAAYNSPFGLTLNSDLNFTATSGYSDGFDTRQWVWNASIGYQFLRDRNATVSLKAVDILNQTKRVIHNDTGNYEDDTRYNTLGRYVMVTLSYRFNTFGKGKEPASREGRRYRGPGGPPPGHRPGGPGPR